MIHKPVFRVTSLAVEGYRTLRKVVLDDLGALVVLHGENDAGKSSILRALRHSLYFATGRWAGINTSDFGEGPMRFFVTWAKFDARGKALESYGLDTTIERVSERPVMRWLSARPSPEEARALLPRRHSADLMPEIQARLTPISSGLRAACALLLALKQTESSIAAIEHPERALGPQMQARLAALLASAVQPAPGLAPPLGQLWLETHSRAFTFDASYFDVSRDDEGITQVVKHPRDIRLETPTPPSTTP